VKWNDAYRWMVVKNRHTLPGIMIKTGNSSDKWMGYAPLKQEAEVFAAQVAGSSSICTANATRLKMAAENRTNVVATPLSH
jgi:hypothetical protein